MQVIVVVFRRADSRGVGLPEPRHAAQQGQSSRVESSALKAVAAEDCGYEWRGDPDPKVPTFLGLGRFDLNTTSWLTTHHLT
jgi:hypothetical protein